MIGIGFLFRVLEGFRNEALFSFTGPAKGSIMRFFISVCFTGFLTLDTGPLTLKQLGIPDLACGLS